jgi:hypothetical protein
MPFQTQVGVQPAVAVAGDFASSNPRNSVLAGQGGLVAGPNGVTVGRFAWAVAPLDDVGAPTSVSNTGFGPVTGFVHREQQALITTYLAESSMLVPQGFPITLFSTGDFWVKNDGTTTALFGQKCYANYADGRATFAATGSPIGGALGTGTIASTTATFNASISGNVLTVTAMATGTLVIGAIISGGTGVITNTAIVSQLTGSVGGTGTYLVNFGEQTVASALLTGTWGLLNVTAATTSTFAVGDLLTGSGVAAATNIVALGTGTGGTGTYIVQPAQNMSSSPIGANVNVETKWIAMSEGLAGELVKISAVALG